MWRREMTEDLKRSDMDAQPSGWRLPDAVKSAAALGGGAAILICLAVGAMIALTSPDGWVMKAASHAMATAQQGTLASYEIALD
jgi:hypothetical protein